VPPRLVITGAAGALGRRLVPRARAAGWEVLGVDRDEADVTSPEQLAGVFAGAAAVVHLAALPSPVGHSAHEVLRVNLSGTLAVLLAAEEVGVERVVLASSINAVGAAYSPTPRFDAFPVTEDHPSYAEDPYAISKFLGEQAADAFARRRPSAALTSLRFHALREEFTVDRDEDRVKDLWGWVSFVAASSACLLALQRNGSGHLVANVVSSRAAGSAPSAQLAERFHPGVPWTVDPVGHRSFWATEVAAGFGWDAAVDDPPVTSREAPW
jgi:NAD(P)-dependent dehydrogenase (short-subunit alcohol dehydrogenase family)